MFVLSHTLNEDIMCMSFDFLLWNYDIAKLKLVEMHHFVSLR